MAPVRRVHFWHVHIKVKIHVDNKGEAMDWCHVCVPTTHALGGQQKPVPSGVRRAGLVEEKNGRDKGPAYDSA